MAVAIRGLPVKHPQSPSMGNGAGAWQRHVLQTLKKVGKGERYWPPNPNPNPNTRPPPPTHSYFAPPPPYLPYPPPNVRSGAGTTCDIYTWRLRSIQYSASTRSQRIWPKHKLEGVVTSLPEFHILSEHTVQTPTELPSNVLHYACSFQQTMDKRSCVSLATHNPPTSLHKSLASRTWGP